MSSRALSNSVRRLGALTSLALLLSGCGGGAPVRNESAAEKVAADESAKAIALGEPAVAKSTAMSAADVPARASADFNRAVTLMRSGKTTDAELEFKQLALAYPQMAGAQLNLGLLYRKAERLDDAEAALRKATELNPGNAVAWNEFGVALRMHGKFNEAATAYERAIQADANFVAAYRNLGVLCDLYLGDPERALTAFERYKELSREEKPVSGWIAELRQRTGKPAAPSPNAAPKDSPPAESSAEPAQPPQPSGKAGG